MARLKADVKKPAAAPSAPPAVPKKLGKAALAEIVAFAKQQVDLEARIAKGNALLADLNKQLTKVSMEDLPTAMAEAGLKEFTLDSGETILIKEDFNVGIPGERQAEAYAWLEKNGYGAIIKCEVGVRFGKGDLAKAQKLQQELVKKKLEATLERSVHWQTLKAFVTERARAAKAVPPDLFGVHQLNKAKVSLPK